MPENGRSEVTFDIKEHIGVINSYGNGWTKELNVVSWNDAPAKYDIREWSKDRERMSKGITLRDEEMKELKSLLQEIEL